MVTFGTPFTIIVDGVKFISLAFTLRMTFVVVPQGLGENEYYPYRLKLHIHLFVLVSFQYQASHLVLLYSSTFLIFSYWSQER